MLPLISLFCGPGGFDEGFKKAGFTTLLAIDNDLSSIKTHRANHPEAQAELIDLLQPDVENKILQMWKGRTNQAPLGVIGGPPCQTFSISSSYNLIQKALDPRNSLPESYSRILKCINAEYNIDFFIMENVPGLKNRRSNHKFERFKELFQLAGFNVFEGTLNAVNFGVPQYRERIFVVGLNAKKYPGKTFQFPTGDNNVVTVKDVIYGLPEPDYFNRKTKICGSTLHPNHWTMNPVSPKWANGEIATKTTGRSFRPLKWLDPSCTIAFGNREANPHPDCKRRLSVFEAMLLQGFTKDYVLLGTLSSQYRMISEVVAPPVAKALAESICSQLGYYK